VRVIGATGDQLGVMSTEEAILKARDLGLDLVEVAAQMRPPVCRIMDYGKFKYAQKKKQQGSKSRSGAQTMKEVKLRPKTEEHDYQVKLKHITRFLLSGHKVKITVRFRGRELAHKDLGTQMLEKIIKDAGDLAVMASQPYMEGRMLQMVLASSPKALVIKRSRDEERERALEAERQRRKAGENENAESQSTSGPAKKKLTIEDLERGVDDEEEYEDEDEDDDDDDDDDEEDSDVEEQSV
jgi:translation initiation factor IF-3